MNTECARIADQARRAFQGEAWHGPSLKEVLEDVSAAQAGSHPAPNAHSIWELVLHISVWAEASRAALRGVPMPKIVGTVEDWPAVADLSPGAWSKAKDRLFQAGEQLAQAIASCDDGRLGEIVPGRQYDFYYLFHGIVQHSLYHGGQIALLKRAVQA
jgi:uncharacterized damage-inducible protein DinB